MTPSGPGDSGVPPRSHGALGARAEASPLAQTLLSAQRFVHVEQNGGLVLLAATIVALLWANSPWQGTYLQVFGTKLAVDLGVLVLAKDLQHWINDGLMTIFFFVIGLEVKRELVHGELADVRRAALPVVAALGGMVAPAAIYLALNAGGPGARGWGIPMATDIAFAVGVLALAGSRVPATLRLFLLALAVVDDVGAILVIAVFYTAGLSVPALGVGALVLALIYGLNRLGLRQLGAYVVLGVLLWLAFLESGVHATLAGVLLGLLAPARPFLDPVDFGEVAPRLLRDYRAALDRDDGARAEAILGEMEALVTSTEAPADRLNRLLHPWASYLVLPAFALANAGVALTGDLLRASLASPITLGVALGLLLGKPLGVVGASWLAVRLALVTLPNGTSWRHLVGAGLLAGIGFTVSLFIAGLAFAEPASSGAAKVGIFAASVLAGAAGYLVLRTAAPR